MVYYWIPFLLAFFNAFVIRKKKTNRILSFLIIGYMFLMAAFRDVSVGTDSYRYKTAVEDGVSLHNTLEFVNNFIVDTCYQCNLSYTVYFTIMALITYIPIVYVLNKISNTNNDITKFGVLLFIISNNIYFIESMNAIRQLASSSILLLLYYYLFIANINNKLRKITSILLFIIAFGIHNASIVALPCLFLAKKNLSFKTALFLLSGMLLFSAFAAIILGQDGLYYILSSIEGLFGLHGYSNYIMGEYSDTYNIIGLAVLLLLPSLSCLYIKKHNELSVVNLYIYGLLLLGLLAPLTTGALRASQGLIIVELIVVPMIFAGRKKYFNIVYLYLMIYSLYYAYQLITFYPEQEQIAGYKMFF